MSVEQLYTMYLNEKMISETTLTFEEWLNYYGYEPN